jgi:hypothetical protein
MGGKLLVGQQGVPIDEILGWGGGGSTDRSQDSSGYGVSADSGVRPARRVGAQRGLR